MIDPFKTKAINRLKRTKGQIEAIIKMIEEDTYCVDVLTQILAVQGSVKNLAPLILESHLNTCSIKHLTSKDPREKEKFIQELVKAFQFANR